MEKDYIDYARRLNNIEAEFAVEVRCLVFLLFDRLLIGEINLKELTTRVSVSGEVKIRRFRYRNLLKSFKVFIKEINKK